MHRCLLFPVNILECNGVSVGVASPWYRTELYTAASSLLRLLWRSHSPPPTVATPSPRATKAAATIAHRPPRLDSQTIGACRQPITNRLVASVSRDKALHITVTKYIDAWMVGINRGGWGRQRTARLWRGGSPYEEGPLALIAPTHPRAN